MTFWSSSEATSEASELFRPLRNKVEADINESLSAVVLASQWDGWKWAFIAIIMSKEFDHYPERVRRNTKHKVLEFRLKIDHDLFVASSPGERLSLYLTELQRSVGLMGKWKMSEKDRTSLSDVLRKSMAA